MTAINELFEQFLQHGSYVRDWSPQTVTAYRQSISYLSTEITKASLNAAVVAMRGRGLTPGGINLRIRSINSFLTWLHEEGHVPERFKLNLLKNPPKPIQVLSDQETRPVQAEGTSRSTTMDFRHAPARLRSAYR
jgi:site-specific recombinase XerD